MKKRFKIILTVITMCIILGTGSFGVYALTQLSMTFNTSIGFISPIKKMAIHASVSGNKGTAIPDFYYDPENHYASKPDGSIIQNDLNTPWSIGVLEFKDTLDDIVITIDITNLEDTAINTALSSSSTFTNVTPTYVNATSIAKNVTKSSTVTLSISDFGSSFEFSAEFLMTIS